MARFTSGVQSCSETEQDSLRLCAIKLPLADQKIMSPEEKRKKKKSLACLCLCLQGVMLTQQSHPLRGGMRPAGGAYHQGLSVSKVLQHLPHQQLLTLLPKGRGLLQQQPTGCHCPDCPENES